MKVILEIDDKYAGVLSITAVGSEYLQTWVSTTAVDLAKNNLVILGNDGKWMYGKVGEDGKA